VKKNKTKPFAQGPPAPTDGGTGRNGKKPGKPRGGAAEDPSVGSPVKDDGNRQENIGGGSKNGGPWDEGD